MSSHDAGYRTGRRVANTLYLDGVFIGSCVTPEAATELVEAANRGRPTTQPPAGIQRQPFRAANLKLGDKLRLGDDQPQTVSAVRLMPDGDIEVELTDAPPIRLQPDDEVVATP